MQFSKCHLIIPYTQCLHSTNTHCANKTGFEPLIHGLQREWSTTELPDLLMNGHKNSIYQVQNLLFTNQSGIRNCHKMTNCEQFQTKCCVKISATLTLPSLRLTCLFDKNVPRMLQQEGILSVLKNIFSRVKWVAILLRQVIIIENRRSLLYP